ncbi:MAG: hypothetical protein IPK75_16370 [Acidobacteria bacterium]|nr:hypothetical protein [Acidobacteriota bacterium]
MTDDTNAPAKPGWHFWPVGILGSLWNAFGCFDFTMTATRNEAYLKPYPPELLQYWFNMPWWTWGIWAVGVFGGLAGTAALLMRKSAAVTLLAASFLAALFSMIIGATATDAPKMEGAEIMPLVIIGIAFLLLAYAYWQNRRGVLR